ncbi:MAG TPA: tRNA pseudouridine(55) synthase TruB [Actinomycetota bacterium]|nr:tRNA pseudouridine(55) synthase TruB [Actinomycetota bacterium]
MTDPAAVSGLLVVDKPTGCTSHDVVNRLRRVFGTSKVGHAGTLDPAATGVLVAGIGKATRLLAFLQGTSKEYRAVVRFGVTTTTQDAEGEIVSETSCELDIEKVRAAAEPFVGEISQLPPMVSAVKVRGEPLYKAARRGEEVEREPRTVRIFALEVESFDPSNRSATVYVKCSSGTFIRTLGADLGESLGCGAHLSALRRLSVGSFNESEAVSLEDLEKMDREQAEAALLPMHEAMRDFPRRTVEGSELDDVVHGRELLTKQAPLRLGELPVMTTRRTGDRPAHEAGMTAGIPVAILGPDGQLVAVYRRSAKGLKAAAVLI